jgi:hypothetical protein
MSNKDRQMAKLIPLKQIKKENKQINEKATVEETNNQRKKEDVLIACGK